MRYHPQNKNSIKKNLMLENAEINLFWIFGQKQFIKT